MSEAGERHCLDPLFPHANLFRHNAADRGHAARDAEDRPFLPAHTGHYDDEKCFFSDLRGQHTGAVLRNDRRCRALHGALRALFSLGVNECASGKISKWNNGISGNQNRLHRNRADDSHIQSGVHRRLCFADRRYKFSDCA